jgi:deoxycytidylate deaminase
MKTTIEIADDLFERRNLQGTRRMIAVDTNLLIYAHKQGSPFHEAAVEAITPCGNCALHPTDVGFSRFKGLKWKNPVA